MSETVHGHADLVERVTAAIRAADEAWYIEHYPETPAEKLRQWTEELHDNFRVVAEAAIAALSTPIAAHGAGAVTEAMYRRARATWPEPWESYNLETALRRALDAALGSPKPVCHHYWKLVVNPLDCDQPEPPRERCERCGESRVQGTKP